MATWQETRELHQQGIPFTLPSGIEVRLRPVFVGELFNGTDVLDTLTPYVVKLIGNVTAETTDALFADATGADLKAFYDAIHMVFRAAMVEPRIVDDPADETGMTLAMFSDEDKGFVFGLLNKPAAELARFREFQTSALSSMAGGEAFGTEAEPSDGHQHVGGTADRDAVGSVDGVSI